MGDTTEKELADSITLRCADETDLAAATKAPLDPNDAHSPLQSMQDESENTASQMPSARQPDNYESNLLPSKKRKRGKPILRIMVLIYKFILAIPLLLIALSGYELIADPSASHILKSMIFALTNDSKSQLSELNEALKLKDNTLLRRNRADLLIGMSNFPAARDEYQRILDSGAKDPVVLDNLARCRIMCNQDDAGTRKDIEQAFDLTSSKKEKRWLMQLLVLNGKYVDAQLLLDKFKTQNANPDWITRIDRIGTTTNTNPDWLHAIILERTGKISEARAAYEAIDSGAFQTELSWSRALFYLGGNELSKARAELDKQEKQHQSNCSLRGLLEAWYSLQTGDYSKALAMSEMSMKNIKNIENYYQQAGVYWANHKLKALVYEKQGDTKNLEKEKAELKHIPPLWHIYVPRNFNMQ